MHLNYKTIFMMFALLVLLPSCSQPKKQHDNNQQQVVSNASEAKTVDVKKDVVDLEGQQIHELLQKLQQQFVAYEQQNPQQGYCVAIDEVDGSLQGVITPHGGRRIAQELSGMPVDVTDYKQHCAFCYYRNHQSDARFIKDFGDGTYAVTSLNHQILVIPQEHYAHLFATPEDMQVAILKNMLAIRKQHPDKIRRPMEFHCGSAAGQTVFHLHGRTGVYV